MYPVYGLQSVPQTKSCSLRKQVASHPFSIQSLVQVTVVPHISFPLASTPAALVMGIAPASVFPVDKSYQASHPQNYKLSHSSHRFQHPPPCSSASRIIGLLLRSLSSPFVSTSPRHGSNEKRTSDPLRLYLSGRRHNTNELTAVVEICKRIEDRLGPYEVVFCGGCGGVVWVSVCTGDAGGGYVDAKSGVGV